MPAGSEVPACCIVVPAQPTPDPHGDHAPAIVAVLEMYGLVGAVMTDAPPPARSDGRWPAIVIITRRADWGPVRPFIAAALAADDGPCLVLEGPLPADIAARVGLQDPGDAHDDAAARPRVGSIRDDRIREQLEHLLDGLVAPGPVRLDAIHTTAARVEVGEDGRPRKIPVEVVAGMQQPSDAHRPVVAGSASLEPLLVDEAKPEHVLLGRFGRVLASSFPLLDLLCRRLSAPRLDHPALRMTGERDGQKLELLLMAAIARASRAAGRPLVTVEPWPEGVAGVLTIRHDVDRPGDDATWSRLLRWEADERLMASWYFLERTADHRRMRDIARLGHEVGFHYTDLAGRGAAESQAIRKLAARARTEVRGACCHGGNFHGLRDVEWLESAGFAYGELLTRCSHLPFRPLADDGAGRIRPMDLLATARHVSVDRTLSPPTADFSHGLRTMAARHRLGGHVVVMNHPDINFEALVEAIGAARHDRQESWTQAQVVDWWRASHLDGVRIFRRSTQDQDVVHLVHQARRPPVLRVWSDPPELAMHPADDRFGEVHRLVPATGVTLVRGRVDNTIHV